MAYDWPGNIRELENYIERAVVICQQDQIGDEQLPLDELNGRSQAKRIEEGLQVGWSVRDMEKKLILKTLEACTGNRTTAADMLGISSRTLRNKLHEYGMAGVFRGGISLEDVAQ